jgi:hypothetical protein
MKFYDKNLHITVFRISYFLSVYNQSYIVDKDS